MLINEMSLSRSYKNVPFVEIDSKLLREYMDFCCNSLNKKNVIIAVGYSDDESSIRYHVNNRYIPDFIVGYGLHLSVANSIVRLRNYLEGSLAKEASKICVNGVFDFESFKLFFGNQDSKLYKLIENANSYCNSLFNVIKKLYDDIESFNLDNGFDDSETINLSRYAYKNLCVFKDGEIVETGEVYSKTRIDNVELIEVCRKVSDIITNNIDGRSQYGRILFGVSYNNDGVLYPSVYYNVTSFLVKHSSAINYDDVENWIKSQHNYVIISIYDCLEVWSDGYLHCVFQFSEIEMRNGVDFSVSLTISDTH